MLRIVTLIKDDCLNAGSPLGFLFSIGVHSAAAAREIGVGASSGG